MQINKIERLPRLSYKEAGVMLLCAPILLVLMVILGTLLFWPAMLVYEQNGDPVWYLMELAYLLFVGWCLWISNLFLL